MSRLSNTGQTQRVLQNRSSRSANPHKHRKTELRALKNYWVEVELGYLVIAAAAKSLEGFM